MIMQKLKKNGVIAKQWLINIIFSLMPNLGFVQNIGHLH